MQSESDIYLKLSSEKSLPLITELKTYISKGFTQLSNKYEDISEISFQFQEYVNHQSNEFMKLYNIDINSDKKIYATIINCIENLLTKSLYNDIIKLFNNQNTNYKQLLFVRLFNLGITDYNYNQNKSDLAIELYKFTQISKYKSPSEKITILMNLCNFINITYSKFDKVKLAKFLAYIFIHSEINDLKNQLLFCSLFRNKIAINSDEDYFLTIALQAVDYSIKLNHKNVNMSKEDFNQCKEKTWDNELVKELEEISDYTRFGRVVNLPIEKIYYKYFLEDNCEEYSIGKYAKMKEEFKSVVKLIENEKNNKEK